MRFLFLLLLAFPAFSQSCDDIVSTYDGQVHALTVPHRELVLSLSGLLSIRPEVYPKRLSKDDRTYTFLTFVMYWDNLPRPEKLKGLFIQFEDGSEMRLPDQIVTPEYGPKKGTALVVVTPQNAIDFTTKKIKSFQMASKKGKVKAEAANAAMVYTKCLLEY